MISLCGARADDEYPNQDHCYHTHKTKQKFVEGLIKHRIRVHIIITDHLQLYKNHQQKLTIFLCFTNHYLQLSRSEN
jgi:hypothetical protein